jgi:hypothetical protein
MLPVLSAHTRSFRPAFTLIALASALVCLVAARPARAAAPICGYDPQASSTLASLTAAPIANAADADVRFKCLEQILRARGDRRAPFATLYSTTTTNVNAAIAAGHFTDAAWVSRYLASFAELYRAAFHDDETGHDERVPQAWRTAFAAARSGNELIIQDLALGVNAHVDHDLAYALDRVGIGTTASERAVRYLDHTRVNDVLRAEVQSALATMAQLYAPGYGEAPPVVMQILGDTFFAFLVTGRQQAWDEAVALAGSHDPFSRFLIATWIDGVSSGAADVVMAPSLSPELIAVLRKLEQG